MGNSKLLVVIEGQTAERDFLRSDFLLLAQKSFSRVVFLCSEEKLDFFQKSYQGSNISFEGFREQKENWLREKFFQLLRHSIPTRTSRLRLLRTIYKRDGLQFNFWLLFFWPCYLSWYLSRYKFWVGFLKFLWRVLVPMKNELALLKMIKPDLVYLDYTPVGIKNFNLKLLKAARKLGILTVGNIVSWDQLTSKAFITEQSDFLFCHNENIQKEAAQFGGFKKERIFLTGAPRFDFYAKKEIFLSREEFFQKIGADPSKKLVIFAGGLREFDIDYGYFLQLFSHLAKNELQECQFYLRPYPEIPFSQELLKKCQNDDGLVFEKSGDDFEVLLANLFRHSSILICVYSTLMIEACLMDLPIINLSYFPNAKHSKYYEPQRQLGKNHLAQIFRGNCCVEAKSDENLKKQIKKYLQEPSFLREQRKTTAKEQLFNIDGSSAVMTVKALEKVKNTRDASGYLF